MTHDHLCLKPVIVDGWCFECATLLGIREDERHRVVEQIEALPPGATRDEVLNAIRPLPGDPLRRPVAPPVYPK